MNTKFLTACIERGFFLTLFHNLDKGCRYLAIRRLRRHIKIDPKKIVFLNFTGNYDCNPRAICQELIDEDVDCEIVWGVNPGTRVGPGFFPPEVKTATRMKFDIYKELASAKVIVDNGISTAYMHYPKKKGQYLVETWHGSIGIKKFGRSANNDTDWLRSAAREGKMTDFIISNSTFEDEVYREDFWKKTPIWQFGHPRNDLLFASDEVKERIDKKVREEYGIPEGYKLCMYAPTFREDGDFSPYNIDYDRLTAALEKRFGGKWAILTRFHARTKKMLKGLRVPTTVFNVSTYPDIQDLQLIVDCGITDYSSWICEYVLTRKPGFTFATDVNDYASHQRTLFWPLSELPFPTSSNVDQLIENIENFDNEKYVNDVNDFLARNGSVDDGHAAERVVAEIKKLLG